MDPATLISLIQGGGVAGIIALLVYVWRDAASRADRLQLERDALLERVLTTFNSATQAMKDQNQLIASVLSGHRPMLPPSMVLPPNV